MLSGKATRRNEVEMVNAGIIKEITTMVVYKELAVPVATLAATCDASIRTLMMSGFAQEEAEETVKSIIVEMNTAIAEGKKGK